MKKQFRGQFFGFWASLMMISGCADSDGESQSSATQTGAQSSSETSSAHDHDSTDGLNVAFGYFFSVDSVNNLWNVTVVDPTQANPLLASFRVDSLSALTGASGNGAGPNWGDAVAAPDGRRIFANAASADRLLVLDTGVHGVEALLPTGKKPLHMYLPDDANEVWSHHDDEGSFLVVDAQTLQVKATVPASLNASGHGKLLHAPALGRHYFATNVNDPGAWAIDGETHEGTFIGLCSQPCADDPATPEDESLQTCGGTHDKTYDPASNLAVFQCSGASAGHVALVDAATNVVVQDLLPLAVDAFAYTHDKKINLVFDNTNNLVGIWNANAAGHELPKFDATLSISGSASGRGTDFRLDANGEWEAWIPQSAGTKVIVANLTTLHMSEVEIGAFSAPSGSAHPTRRGALAGDWYFTHSDAGIVAVNVHTYVPTVIPAVIGDVGRVAATVRSVGP